MVFPEAAGVAVVEGQLVGVTGRLLGASLLVYIDRQGQVTYVYLSSGAVKSESQIFFVVKRAFFS